MRYNQLWLFATLIALLWVAGATAQEKAAQPEQFGKVHFPCSQADAERPELMEAKAFLAKK